MTEYPFGTAVELDFTFKTDSDDDGVLDDPTDPTTVTFEIEKPDGSLLTYDFPHAAIDNPSTGRYVLTLSAAVLDLVGQYAYRVEGTGDVEAAASDSFQVVGDAISAPAEAPTPTGICSAWFDVNTLRGRCQDVSWNDLLGFAYAASEILFMASGEQFPGSCGPVIVRPCNHLGACGGQVLSRGHVVPPTMWPPGGIDGVGCCNPDEVWLAGYPVRRIDEVTIDGETLVEGDDYALVQRYKLMRLADPTTGAARRWPTCSRRDLPAGDPGTFTIEYSYGADPPVSGKLAAAALAYELYAACPGTSGTCSIPMGVKTIVRQGVTIDKASVSELLSKGLTGILEIDRFLSAFGGPAVHASVWSPDVPEYPTPVG